MVSEKRITSLWEKNLRNRGKQLPPTNLKRFSKGGIINGDKEDKDAQRAEPTITYTGTSSITYTGTFDFDKFNATFIKFGEESRQLADKIQRLTSTFDRPA